MPDQKRRSRAEPQVAHEPDEVNEKHELPFILEELEKDDSALTSSVVNERIESFLSPHQPGDKLSLADWERVRMKILTSFTAYQLSDYIMDAGNVKSVAAEEESRAKIAEWKPGTSTFVETASEGSFADRIASSRYLKGKRFSAEKILRDCWKLGIAGELGQIDMRLPETSLSLLLNSEHFSFDELASLHEAKIDVTKSFGLIRITGRQHTCESIREIIYDTTMRVREEEIEQAKYKPEFGRALSSDFLDWISKTYGVAFENVTPLGPKKILYLAENKKAVDEVRRTLSLAFYSANPEPIPFATYLSSSEPANAYNINPEQNATWFDRQKSWFRWAMPSTQASESKPLAAPFFDRHQTRLSDGLFKLLRKPTANSCLSERVGVHETITAAVGKSLFLRKPNMDNTSVDAARLGKMALPRTFTTDLHRVASFLRPLSQQEDNRNQLHRIQLVPSAIHAEVFPKLDFEVAVDQKAESPESGTELVVHSAKAIMAESSVDYLLPENGLDLRFTRKMYCDLLKEGIWQKSGEMAGSLQSCLLDLLARERLNGTDLPLPPFISLSLPKEILHEQSSPSSTEDSSEFTTGEYMFLPVTDRRGTRLHRYGFHDQRLNYSYYESGPFYPHRTTDLFLDMDFTVDDTEPFQEFNSFYGAACKLAFELDTAYRTDV